MVTGYPGEHPRRSSPRTTTSSSARHRPNQPHCAGRIRSRRRRRPAHQPLRSCRPSRPNRRHGTRSGSAWRRRSPHRPRRSYGGGCRSSRARQSRLPAHQSAVSAAAPDCADPAADARAHPRAGRRGEPAPGPANRPESRAVPAAAGRGRGRGRAGRQRHGGGARGD